jgi:hypothetical protein
MPPKKYLRQGGRIRGRQVDKEERKPCEKLAPGHGGGVARSRQRQVVIRVPANCRCEKCSGCSPRKEIALPGHPPPVVALLFVHECGTEMGRADGDEPGNQEPHAYDRQIEPPCWPATEDPTA